MNFVDATLVRLADPTSRTQLFDATALEQMVAAAYDTSVMDVGEPFSPVFEEFRLGFAVVKIGTIEGIWAPPGSPSRTEVSFRVSGIGDGTTVRVDALWRGQIVARTAPTDGQVTAVQRAWPDAGTIDAEIIADLGALPAGAKALEQERRSRFLTRIRAAFDQPATFTDSMFDRWLESVGVTSVSDLLERFQGVAHAGALQVTFSPPAAGPLSPKALPIAAALLIRDVGFSVAELLMESKMAREQIEPLGLERPRDPSFRLRHPMLIIWVIPIAVFDDEGWPGATQNDTDQKQRQAARRAAAGAWLAREGIGLMAIE